MVSPVFLAMPISQASIDKSGLYRLHLLIDLINVFVLYIEKALPETGVPY